MGIVIAFVLGMGNFAWHRAVLESGHRMVADTPPETLRAFRLTSLTLEFILLVGALYAAALGHYHWLWAYAGYSLLNGSAAYLMLKGRI